MCARRLFYRREGNDSADRGETGMTTDGTAQKALRRRIWGWFFFDWASQPYNTLLITFIFAPYVKELMGDGSAAQAAWGFGIGAAGLVIALLAPLLGAVADSGGHRLRWIWLFSALYMVGSGMLWFAAPSDFNLSVTLFFFALGLVGMEFATIFTNAMLPDLGPREEIGRISGNGWAFGYLGGLIALALMLALFAESAATGKTLLGIDPIFGLDAAQREGTRSVGPLTALWYAVFMVPFFLWVKEPKTTPRKGAVRRGLAQLKDTLSRLPRRPSLFAYLAARSIGMFSRVSPVTMILRCSPSCRGRPSCGKYPAGSRIQTRARTSLFVTIFHGPPCMVAISRGLDRATARRSRTRSCASRTRSLTRFSLNQRGLMITRCIRTGSRRRCLKTCRRPTSTPSSVSKRQGSCSRGTPSSMILSILALLICGFRSNLALGSTSQGRSTAPRATRRPQPRVWSRV